MTSPLAILGGSPAVTTPPPHFSWPPLGDSAFSAVARQMGEAISIYNRSGVVAELEEALCRYFGVTHTVLTSSGTAALYDLYDACGIQPGDEVIVPAYTFFATVTPLLHLGAIPVLADYDEHGNIDPADASKRITSRTSAIAATHMWGVPADVPALRALAATRDVTLLEDGSHAHGSSICGRKIGTSGNGAAFSMNGPKPLSAGEGGFLATSNDDIYYRALLHGQYNKRTKSEIPEGHPLYSYAATGMGLKHRIHPLAAAIALNQLERLEHYLDGRAQIAAYLIEQLRDTPGIHVPQPDKSLRPSWYGMILQYRAEELDGLPVERFFGALEAEGCAEADRPGSTCPLNLLPLFQKPGGLFPAHADTFAYAPGDFPQAEAFHAAAIKLPVWHREQDMALARQYVSAIQKVSAGYRELLG